MSADGNRAVVDKWVRSIVERDLDLQMEVSRPDVIHDFPQSGERFRGWDNWRAQAENYPGGLPNPTDAKVVGSTDRWVTTPTFTLLRIVGSGDVYTFFARALYSDGVTWHAASLVELREGSVAKVTWIFGAPFDPPEWRAQWVEPIPPAPESAS
jgi:hypothetical protein